MFQKFVRVGLPLAALMLVAGCGFLGEDSDGPPLPGTRISILTFDRGIRPDHEIADEVVRLPRPYRNENWSQPGGSATHVLQHLALGDNPRIVWKADIGAGESDDRRILSQPIVMGNTIYTLDSQALVSAFSAADGKRIWKKDLEDEDEDGGYFGGGISYENGRLFVTTGFARAFALDASNGEVLWERRAPGPIHNGPAVFDGRVYVLSLDNRLQVLAAEDGRILWTNVGVEEAASIIGESSVAVESRIAVVPYTSGDLLGIDVETGRALWQENFASLRRFDPLTDIPHIRALPLIDGDRVFAVSHSGRMRAIELETGRPIWEERIGGVETPWIAGEYLFVLSDDSQFVALRREDGRIRWVTLLPRYEDEEEQEGLITWRGPVLAGDRLIIAGSHGKALSVSPYDGAELGEVDLPGSIAVAPTVAGETLYFVTTSGTLVAYK